MEPAVLEHRHLRGALEFTVALVAEGQKRRPPIKYPPALRPFLKLPRLPASALGPVRRAIEDDPGFRSRIALGAVPELVGPIGSLWLQRPAGWQEQIGELVARANAEEAEAETQAALRRAEKRREAAEQATLRTRAELVRLNDRIAQLSEEGDVLRALVAKHEELTAEMRAEVVDARNETRHANDRAGAALARLERAEAERAAALARTDEAEGVRDQVLADRAMLAADAAELAGLTAQAQDLTDRLASLTAPADERSAARKREAKRRPLALPGGVVGDSDTATEYLVRSGASVLIDGYNVAKLGWPDLDLADQRQVVLDALENLARRFGSDLTVVFDGADVVGAATDQRRLVRVVFSPESVTADDVIRGEVRRLPASRHVVVVTNDAEIIRDVRVLGANTVSSGRFLAIARR